MSAGRLRGLLLGRTGALVGPVQQLHDGRPICRYASGGAVAGSSPVTHSAGSLTAASGLLRSDMGSSDSLEHTCQYPVAALSMHVSGPAPGPAPRAYGSARWPGPAAA